MVNMQFIEATQPKLQDKRQLENCVESKRPFIADSIHEKGLTSSFRLESNRNASVLVLSQTCSSIVHQEWVGCEAREEMA